MGGLRTVLEQRGIERAFLQVDAAEPYSRACHESLGFRTVGRLAAVRLRGAYWVGVSRKPGNWTRRGRGVLDLEAWGA
jgi:L-amino acid N-acyltransferase YncA